MGALWTTVAIMTLGFAVLGTSHGEAMTLSAPHAAAPKGISTLWGVSCPSVTHCVAVGTANGSTRSKYIPGATGTVNGGASWYKGRLQGGPNQVVNISCATEKKCVGVGFTGSASGNFTAGTVVTSNGGRSWTGHLLAGAAGMLNAVACPSTTRCVAVGANVAADGEVSSLVFVTSDGGTSWVPGTLQNGTGVLADVSCPTTNVCLAVGTSLPTSGSSPAGMDVIYSKDGGSSWTTATSPGTGELSGISCPNSRDCVTVGSSNGLAGPPQSLFTTDSGGAWSSATLPDGIGYLSKVTCPSSRECIALGTHGNPVANAVPPAAIYSLDGGRSWSTGKLSGTKAASVNAVACSTVTRCVAVGSSGAPTDSATTSVTNNGGRTWS
jgi:photosystem II stability/assembly factor-like uncharacterized protein